MLTLADERREPERLQLEEQPREPREREIKVLNWDFLRRVVVNFDDVLARRHEYRVKYEGEANDFVSFSIKHSTRKNRRVLIAVRFFEAETLSNEWNRDFRCGCPGLSQCQRAGAMRMKICVHCGLVLMKILEESQARLESQLQSSRTDSQYARVAG